MPLGAQQVVLRLEDALDGAHQHAALAHQVAEDFLLKGGFEEEPAADTDADRDAALARTARRVLVDGERAVDAAAVQEEPSDRRTRALRGAQDHVDVPGRHHAGLLAVNDREAVGEVDGRTRLKIRADLIPALLLRRVVEQVEHDCGLLDRLAHVLQQRLAFLPAFPPGQIVVGIAPVADQDVQAVVAQVERLGAALRAVTDHQDLLVLQDLTDLGHRVIAALDDRFLHATNFERSHLFLSSGERG